MRIDQAKVCLKCGATLRNKGGIEKVREFKVEKPCKVHQWSEMRGFIEIKEFSNWEKDFKAFLAAKKLWEWENEYWLKQIGYL